MPTALNTEFAIGKVDHQFSANNRLSAALHLLRQLHHQQRRRRHRLGAARHRLHRSPAFDGGAADLDHPADAAERAARAVRDARAGPRARRRGRHGPGHQRHQRRQLRRPDRRRRRRRLRVHAERVPGQRQPDVHSRRPRLQVRLRHPARRRHAHAARAIQLYTFADHGRLPGGARAARTRSATRRSRSTSARPTSTTARISTGSIVQDDWRLSTRRQDALRPPLRPLRRAGAQRRPRRSRPRATSSSTRTTGRRASAWSWTLGGRPPHR